MGTRLRYFHKRRSYRDHPHAYGDKANRLRVDICILGSSPRVWGQASGKMNSQPSVRIIPTRMGTRLRYFHKRRSYRDHPHAYGDKRCRKSAMLSTDGSSPRVWGQGPQRNYRKVGIRIIPTRMGTSKHTITLVNGNKDHPHAYGDKAVVGASVAGSLGSSPRVWGQETIIQISQKGCRIIPTRMGTSNGYVN